MSISSETLHKHLKEIFGFNSFKGKQEQIIQNLLEEKDSMVIMPTGGGKSMCFQLPALISDGLAIVISPLEFVDENVLPSNLKLSTLRIVATALLPIVTPSTVPPSIPTESTTNVSM